MASPHGIVAYCLRLQHHTCTYTHKYSIPLVHPYRIFATALDCNITHTHTNTYTYIYTDTIGHSPWHSGECTGLQYHIYTHTHTYIYTTPLASPHGIVVNVLDCNITYTHTHTNICTTSLGKSPWHSCKCASLQHHIYIYIYIYIYTHTHTHTTPLTKQY